MQLWSQLAYVFTVLGGTIPLTSRVPTKQHFPHFLVMGDEKKPCPSEPRTSNNPERGLIHKNKKFP
jgi:hypothetical protein